MKYYIPQHTKCIISILSAPTARVYGVKHIIDKENFFTEFSVILSDHNNHRNRDLGNGWQWIVRLDGGVCMFNSHIFIDIDKENLVPL